MTEFTSKWLTWEPPETSRVQGARSDKSPPDAEPTVQDAGRSDSADSPLTALTTLSVPIGQTQKQAELTTGTPTAPSPNQTPLPDSWTAAAARLRDMDRSAHVDLGRWQQILGDTQRLLDDLGEGWTWAKELAALGWSLEDLFGRDDLDHQSVAWLVQGRRIGPVTKIAIVLRGTDDSITWVYRRDSADSSDHADSPSPETSRPTPETPGVRTAKTAKRWDPGTATLIKWFLDTTPPAQPFELQQAVVIARPGKYWEYLRQDIAAGPQRARGKTGAFQENLRQLYRIFHDSKDIGGGTA